MRRHFLLAFVLTFCIACTAIADRTLSRDEILQIFQQLTSQPRKTWIPAGTIEAMRSEYKAPKITDQNELTAIISQKTAEYVSDTNKRELTQELQTLALEAMPFNVRHKMANESTMDSQVIVKYDGSKFYWEINVTSRNDSVKPDKTLRANYMTKQFNLMGNARRIFVWDGVKYTNYFLPINQASVDTANSTPRAVNGPLTAGVIPWGYGIYSYDNLTAANTSGVETSVDNQTQIQLTINKANGTETVLTLDPAKNYAVISYAVSRPNGPTTLQQYSNYCQIAGNWVPKSISLEKYEPSTNRLLSRDQWDITEIDANVPDANAFRIDFEPAAMIQYSNPNTAVCSNIDRNKVNCATTAIKTTAAKFGKNVGDEIMTSLVSKDNQTSLLAIKKFINGLGLYCTAVNTDLQSLQNLKDCSAIVHLKDKKHFVTLDELNREAQTADLAKCAALLISDKPFEKQIAAIPDARLNGITGAGYSCTKVIQPAGWSPCAPPEEGVCDEENFGYYYQVKDCESAASGTCSSNYVIAHVDCPCSYDAWANWCESSGEWVTYYQRACWSSYGG